MKGCPLGAQSATYSSTSSVTAPAVRTHIGLRAFAVVLGATALAVLAHEMGHEMLRPWPAGCLITWPASHRVTARAKRVSSSGGEKRASQRCSGRICDAVAPYAHMRNSPTRACLSAPRGALRTSARLREHQDIGGSRTALAHAREPLAGGGMRAHAVREGSACIHHGAATSTCARMRGAHQLRS